MSIIKWGPGGDHLPKFRHLTFQESEWETRQKIKTYLHKSTEPKARGATFTTNLIQLNIEFQCSDERFELLIIL